MINILNLLQKKSVLVFLPQKNFNEEEYFTIKLFLQKHKYNLFIASDSHTYCVGNCGARVKNDISILNVNEKNFSTLIIIGGEGVRNYFNSEVLRAIINKFYKSKQLIAAICLAPIVLAKSGILKEHSATCYKTDEVELKASGVEFKDQEVVISKNIITASNPLASGLFAEAIIEYLKKN